MTDYVHPGWVRSINDGDRHYIGFVNLCRLYRLRPDRVLNGDDPRQVQGRVPEDGDRHLTNTHLMRDY